MLLQLFSIDRSDDGAEGTRGKALGQRSAGHARGEHPLARNRRAKCWAPTHAARERRTEPVAAALGIFTAWRGRRKRAMLLNSDLLDQLAIKTDAKMIFLVMDGLGGMEVPEKGGSELQVARTPNLDALAAGGVCGLFDPVAPGITPGSGPGHFAIFGYHPIVHNIGRGILSACGIDFPLTPRDVAARVNFCTIDQRRTHRRSPCWTDRQRDQSPPRREITRRDQAAERCGVLLRDRGRLPWSAGVARRRAFRASGRHRPSADWGSRRLTRYRSSRWPSAQPISCSRFLPRLARCSRGNRGQICCCCVGTPS